MDNEKVKDGEEPITTDGKSALTPHDVNQNISGVTASVSENIDKTKYKEILAKVLGKFGKDITEEVARSYSFSVPYPVQFNSLDNYFYVEDNRVVRVNTGIISESAILEFLGGKDSEEGGMFAKVFGADGFQGGARIGLLFEAAGVAKFYGLYGGSNADKTEKDLAALPGFKAFHSGRQNFRQ